MQEPHDVPTVVLGAPWTRDEISVALVRTSAACSAFWDRFPTSEFLAPIGAAWSPADNVRHLIKSTRPIGLALRLPRPVLALLFGRAQRPSRTFAGVRADYAGVLGRGGKAGRFAPRPAAVPRDAEAWRRQLMQTRRRADASVVAAAARWHDADLDRYRLPHPLLGRLSIREMLFFTLYHGVHHVDNVMRRKGLRAT